MPKLPELIYPEDTENWPRAFWRRQYLDILDEEEPEAKRQLKSELLPSFQETMRSAFPHETDLRSFLGVRFDHYAISHFSIDWFRELRSRDPSRIQKFARVLNEWQRRYQLLNAWIRDTVMRTLAAWTIWPERAERGQWTCFDPAFRSAALLGDFSLAGRVELQWDPVIETRASAHERIVRNALESARKYVEPRVDAFLGEVEQRARERGLVEPPKPRQDEKHLRWLVRYQVCGESFSAIARRDLPADPEESGRKAVAAGVHKATGLVELTLRPVDPGGNPSSS